MSTACLISVSSRSRRRRSRKWRNFSSFMIFPFRSWVRLRRSSLLLGFLAPAEHVVFERFQRAHLERGHHRDHGDRPREDLVGLHEVGGLAQPVSYTAGGTERFGD